MATELGDEIPPPQLHDSLIPPDMAIRTYDLGPKDGAPSAVMSIAQTADGSLWLGGLDGLYRFDGVVFEHYQPQSGDPFPVSSVSLLLALPHGDLWIVFRTGGICLLRNRNATNYTAGDGVDTGATWGIAQDREGTIWVASESGLARLEGGRWKNVGKDWNYPGKSALAIFLDREGVLWVATEDKLVFLPPGARSFHTTGIQVGEVYDMAQTAAENCGLLNRRESASIPSRNPTNRLLPPKPKSRSLPKQFFLIATASCGSPPWAADFAVLPLPTC